MKLMLYQGSSETILISVHRPWAEPVGDRRRSSGSVYMHAGRPWQHHVNTKALTGSEAGPDLRLCSHPLKNVSLSGVRL